MLLLFVIPIFENTSDSKSFRLQFVTNFSNDCQEKEHGNDSITKVFMPDRTGNMNCIVSFAGVDNIIAISFCVPLSKN